MKRKNMAAMVTSIALVGVVAVGGTLALLSQGSNTVKNTFTVGEGYTENDIILSEADVKQNFDGSYVVNTGTERTGFVYTTLTGQKRYETNSYPDLVPNTTISKDPMVTVAANTPDSWVVVHVGAVDSVFAGSTFDNSNEDWYQVSKVGGKWTVAKKPVGKAGTEDTPATIVGDTYYIYKSVVETNTESAQELTKLFTTLSVKNDDTIASAAEDTQLVNMEIKAGLVQHVEGTKVATDLNETEIGTIMNAVESKLNVDLTARG